MAQAKYEQWAIPNTTYFIAWYLKTKKIDNYGKEDDSTA